MAKQWLYQAQIGRIKDGDTAEVCVDLSSFNRLEEVLLLAEDELFDLGFSLFLARSLAIDLLAGEPAWLKQQPIRFAGLNAPEKNTEAGIRAWDYVQALLPVNSVVQLETIRVKSRTKQEKYGRYLGRFILPDGRCVNDLLLEAGLAKSSF